MGEVLIRLSGNRFELENHPDDFPDFTNDMLMSAIHGGRYELKYLPIDVVSVPADLHSVEILRERFADIVKWTQPAEEYADKLVEEVEKELAMQSRPKANIPHLACVTKILRPYQTLAVDFGLRFLRFILALDPGLGKTLVSLYIVLCLMAQGPIKRCLIIAPKRRPWVDEFDAMIDVRYQIIGRGETNPAYINSSPFTIVTSEQLLYHLEAGLVSKEQLSSFDAVIIDESVKLANRENVTYMFLLDTFANTPVMILCNGTPIESRLRELYDQVDFVRPGFLGPWPEFAMRYIGPSSKVRVKAPIGEGLLLQRLATVVFRQRMEDVAPEIPEKVSTVIDVGITDRQLELYNQYAKELEGAGRKNALYLMQKLQQVCDDAFLVGDAEHSSAKLVALDELMPSLVMWDRKTILFSQYESWVRYIAERYKSYGAVAYTGRHSPTGKQKIEQAFIDDPKVKVLVCTTAAFRALSFPFVYYVVIADNLWTDMEQLEARARRLTTDHPVHVITLSTGTRFERYKAQVIAEKKSAFKEGLMDHLPALLSSGLIDLEALKEDRC